MTRAPDNEFVPDYAVPPGATLLELLEFLGLTQAELAARAGRPKKTINEIIKGKAAITPDTAVQLERVLGSKASFWNALEGNYRTALVRETCALLHIDNYKVKSSHVLIDGKLGKYSVHLGSGVVHRQPGGSLCIIPVHSQHRGRLFLPFADDDPRTAEVISKVLLLARDHEIQDPSILEQLR